MKKVLLFLLLILIFVVSGCSGEKLNKVVATVDGKEVLYSDVLYYMADDREEKQIIEDLILREAMLIEAEKEEIKMSKKELEELKNITSESLKFDKKQKEYLEGLAKNFNLSLEEFLDTVWVEQTRKDMTVSKYIDKNVNITLENGTPEEYQKKIEDFHNKFRSKILDAYKDKISYKNK